MARLARVVAVDIPHHVTQRGNGRQYILSSDADRRVYLDLLRENAEQHELSIVGYCLMSNHVHLVVVPRTAAALSETLKHTHGRYAAYWNASHGSSGHVWQGRYYSCPLDAPHLWEALRYVELNPVRAGLMAKAEQWAWSSAAAHLGMAVPDVFLEMETWQRRWDAVRWREYLAMATETEASIIRRCTHTGRPLGAEEFVERLEKLTRRRLTPRKGGRPSTRKREDSQAALTFDE